ncbi:MAG TPA: hypothetical protein VIM65_15850 [Cyclobacteriaceae bacterium]
MKTKYQTVIIKKASGTEKSRYTDAIELDTHFEICDGVQIHQITNGGITFYAVGLEDKSNNYQNITHVDDFVCSTSVPINMRYKEISIPVISGEKLEIKTEFYENLTADLEYHVVFRLRKK